MRHVATINAFPNKFGGFTGAIRNEETREIIRERFATFDEARNFVKAKAWETFRPRQLCLHAPQRRIPRQCVGITLAP